MTENQSNGDKAQTPAERLLARAERILANVDESYIITHQGHKQRLVPVFRPEEISLGKTLGKGGFGIVNEIIKFTLDADEEAEQHEKAHQKFLLHSNSINGNHAGRVSTVIDTPEEMTNNDHVHYDIGKARYWMEKRCLRKGVARYALKRLHGDLSELEQARGMIDLAVEAKYLTVVWHPNISKCCLFVCFLRFGYLHAQNISC